MLRFAIASLTPAVLLLCAAAWGGAWIWAALIYMTVFVAGLDRLAITPPKTPDSDTPGLVLSVLLGGAHFAVLVSSVLALSEGTLSTASAIALGVAAGMFMGQVSNSNAHDLIHHAGRWPRRLGVAVYCSLLFGHHASAHPKVHHVWVASARDPNSARAGEGFYAFWPRAWIGSFRAGWAAESALRARKKRHDPAHQPGLHPYAIYIGGAAAALGTAAALGGMGGVLVLLALATYAQMQLILSDYVQHYGLHRRILADGRPEPVGPQHSWNAPHWYSSALMLNAPRHSDHHAHPGRAFWALELTPGTMPMLPQPLPAMAALALIPPLWRRVMDRRAARWRPQPESPGDLAAQQAAALKALDGAGTPSRDLPPSRHDPIRPDSPAPAADPADPA